MVLIGWKFIVVLFLVLASASASACPVCNTETGKEVRATIFGERFGSFLLQVLAPVPVLLLSAAAIPRWLGKE